MPQPSFIYNFLFVQLTWSSQCDKVLLYCTLFKKVYEASFWCAHLLKARSNPLLKGTFFVCQVPEVCKVPFLNTISLQTTWVSENTFGV